MKNLFGLMLMATMLLSASAVFADHAPPNQTAEVSILENVSPAIASTDAIQFSEPATVDNVVFAEVIYLVTTPTQIEIAVSSGQGFIRCGKSNSNYIELKSFKGEIKEGRWLHKPGHNRIARS